MREIPFTVIRFPLWEAMKKCRGERKLKSRGAPVNAAESAFWEFGEQRGDDGNYLRQRWTDMTVLSYDSVSRAS